MMSLVTNNQPNPVNGQIQAINPNVMMMMMMNPPLPSQLPPGQLINAKQSQQQPFSYPQFHQYRSLTPNTLHQQASSPSMTSNLILYPQQQQHQHNSRKKLSCYNCGSMNHPASECKEPTLESISQTNQFRLNFKANNGASSSTSSSGGSAGNVASNQTSESDEMKKNAAPNSSSKNSIVTNTVDSLKTKAANLTKNSVISPNNSSKTSEIVSARRSGD